MKRRLIVLVGGLFFVACGGREIEPEGTLNPDVPPAGSALPPSSPAPTPSTPAPPRPARPSPRDVRLAPDAPAVSTPSNIVDGRPSPTYVADVRPILSLKCDRCHTSGVHIAPQFGTTYAVMLQQAKRCPGKSVGLCVLAALNAQQSRGGWCTPSGPLYHRHGWSCVTPSEIDIVARWVAGGMPEK